MQHHLQCEGIVKEINVNNMYNIELLLCSSRKYPYSPYSRDWKFLGGGGFSKAQKVK